jgi:hypothetical protein
VAKVAANQKLWNSLMKQALAKYPPRSPKAHTSFAANRWASQQYEKSGGSWVGSIKEVNPKLRDPKAELEKKKKAKVARMKRAKKMSGQL